MLSFRYILLFLLLALSLRAAVADQKPANLVIATWNLEWFFDDNQGDNFSDLAKKLSAPTRSDWEWKRDHVAAAIAKMQPTILALQEVENQQVLYYLCQRLRKEHNLNYRIAYVLGSDFYTEQDVAILYRSGLVEFSRKLPTNEQFGDKSFYNIQKHQWARFRWGQGKEQTSLSMLNLHLRATAKAADLRQRQARLAKVWLDEERRGESNIIVLGDFNTEEKTEPAFASELAIFRGLTTKAPSDDFFDLHAKLNVNDRATHMIGAQFDRILVSGNMLPDAKRPSSLQFSQIQVRKDLVIRGRPDHDHRDGYYEIPEAERDLSDHFPIVARFRWRYPPLLWQLAPDDFAAPNCRAFSMAFTVAMAIGNRQFPIHFRQTEHRNRPA